MISDLTFVAIDATLWILWCVLVGFLVNKIPDDKLEKIWLVPLSLKSEDRLKNVFKVSKFKDRLPEAGSLFKGGVSKKNLLSNDIEGLRILRIETLRAELAHYLFPLLAPVFFLFNPLYLSISMAIYAFFANFPFILVQRYNRARIERIISNPNSK